MTSQTTVKRFVASITVAAFLAPAGVVAVADASSSATIKLKGEQFSPRSVNIKKGGKVTFKWAGGTHTLIGPGAKVGPRSSGSKTITFNKPGSFKYVCTIHDNMTTIVKVK